MSCVFSKITVGMVLSLFIFCCISIQAQSCDDGYCDRVIGVDLREGESTSVQWRGQNHTITLLGITQEMGSDVAVVQVDQVSDEIAEGTTSKISGLNVHIPTIFYSGKPGQLGSAALIIGENSMNCHEDCDPTNCPSMIDVWFNSSVYRVGDMGELAIYIFDELGDPMPGEEFNVSYTRNNETVGPSEQTMDPEGYIRTKGTFYDGQEGSYSYHIFISSPVCPYVEDTFSFTVLPNENEIECFDDSDCPSITKRYCEGSNACTLVTNYECINPGTTNSFCQPSSGGKSCEICRNGCGNGKCKENINCTDTDGGKVFDVKGTTVGSNTMGTDYCGIRVYPPESDAHVVVDSCTKKSPQSGFQCTLYEYHCGGTNGSNAEIYTYECPNGCSNGACNPGECSDYETQPCGSDIGECEPGTRTCINGSWGKCEGAVGPSPEICNYKDDDCDGTVDEGCSSSNRCFGFQYFTQIDHFAKTSGEFMISLLNGVNTINVSSITIKDGNNGYTDLQPILSSDSGWDGTDWLWAGKTFTTRTSSDLEIPESYELLVTVEYDVKHGIIGNTDSATCVGLTTDQPFCTETDGGNKTEVKGTLVDPNGVFSMDICMNDYVVQENYCSGSGSRITENVNCGNLGCRMGACVSQTKEIENFRLDIVNNEYVFRMFYIMTDWYIDGKKVDDIEMRHIGGAAYTEYTMPCKEGSLLEGIFVNSYSGEVTAASMDISGYSCAQEDLCGDGACDNIEWTFLEGDEITITHEGKEYNVSLLGVTQNPSFDIAIVMANGIIGEVYEGTSSWFSGIEIYAKDIYYIPNENGTSSAVLVMGENELTCPEDCQAQSEVCGNGVCDSQDISINQGDEQNFEFQGNTYTLSNLILGELHGYATRPSCAGYNINVIRKSMCVGDNTYESDPIPNYLLSTTHQSKVYIAMGMNPYFQDMGDTVVVMGGTDLSGKGQLYLEDNMNKFKGRLTSYDLPVILQSHDFITSDGDFPYNQEIILGSRQTEWHSSGEAWPPGAGPYLQIGTNASEPLYTFVIEFNETYKPNFADADSHGKAISIAGQDFSVSSESTNNKLVLFGGGVTATLSEGDNVTISVDGKIYQIILLGVTSPTAGDTAIVKVNDVSDEVVEGQTRKIGGLNVYAKDVFYLAREDQISSATLVFGSDKITLENGKEVKITIGYDDTKISNTIVNIDLDGVKTKRIEVAVAASDSDEDQILSEEYFEDPVWGSFKTTFYYGAKDDELKAIITVGENQYSCPEDCGSAGKTCIKDNFAGSCTECTQGQSGSGCTIYHDMCTGTGPYYVFHCENQECIKHNCQYGCSNGSCYTEGQPGQIKIYPGWNIISFPYKEATFVGGTCDPILYDKWAFFWWYPIWGRYITLDEANTLGPEMQEELMKMSYWAYSPEKCNLEYSYFGDAYKIHELPMLYDDWNMVMFTNDMVGKSVGDIKGECNLLAMFMWDNYNQQWDQFEDTMSIRSDLAGQGWVTKPTSLCKLALTPTLTPPAFPTGWMIMGR